MRLLRNLRGSCAHIEVLPNNGGILTQTREPGRENRAHLSRAQREMAGTFFRQSTSGETIDLERRLAGDNEAPDVLLRISTSGNVNLPQLVGSNRRPHIVFDRMEGMEKWPLRTANR